MFKRLFGEGPARRPYAEIADVGCYSRDEFKVEFVDPLRAALSEFRATVKRGEVLLAKRDAGGSPLSEQVAELEEVLAAGKNLDDRMDEIVTNLFFASESSYAPFDKLVADISDIVDELKWIVDDLREGMELE